ncbi:MAG: hypothetical protein COW48_05065 [Hydrogenophilales bacterium CG17_big_fil_post_rev_8_21_14_2_50_63_12]|nr:MAG: hypothetical protein COW48_05065 [Hydrogenophilales bacterium CG17_big_fil_post_rev_8_21_14_2_50_63_12]PIX96850.1 MAG: hypothetical protein COZ24_08310 [Hydrogenophilales bacterium CG_4_10_14_3_um_filter_63_21]
MEQVKQLFDAIVGADAWYIAGSPLLGSITNMDEPNGDPENEVLYFTWVGDWEGTEFSERITEEDLANAIVDGNAIKINDPDGDFDIQLYRLAPVEIYLAPPSTVSQDDEEHQTQGHDRARLFMQELLDSVETLTGIAEQHGVRTLADLMFLQNAILSGGFIDHYPGESKVLEIASGLPSGEQWSKFIAVEYLRSEF